MKASPNRSLGSEASVRRFLLTHLERTGWYCPRCKSQRLYLLADQRRRCARCRYTFHELTGRWINEGRLPCNVWLELLRLFEDDVSVQQMEAKLSLSHSTAYHAATVVRLAILAHARDGDQLLADMLSSELVRCKTAPRRVGEEHTSPVFGISESVPQSTVQLLAKLTPCEVLGLPIKKVRRGNVVHTARFGEYDTVVFAADPDVQCRAPTHFARSPVYIDGVSGFWRFASTRLSKHFGITPRRFPLYLKEAEFRYQHRQTEIFPTLVEFLCDHVPHAGAIKTRMTEHRREAPSNAA
jgi:transposase